MQGTVNDTLSGPMSKKGDASPSPAVAGGVGGNPMSGHAMKSSLRQMSFDDGEKALAPAVTDAPVQASSGELTTDPGAGTVAAPEGETTGAVVSTAGGSTTLTEPTTEKSTSGANPPPVDAKGAAEGEKDKSELEKVEEAHQQTVQALVQRLMDLRMTKQKVFVLRREKNVAADAKGIFRMLKHYDSQTITAAWQLARGEAATEFDLLIDAIAYKDAARSFPREARATLMACEPERLERFAEDTVKKNPFASQLAVSLMPAELKADFQAKHPGLMTSEKVTEKDKEKLDAELLSLKDVSLRQDEEKFRERMQEARAGDDAKDELAKANVQNAEPLVARVRELASKKQFQEALGALAAEGDEAIFIAAVKLLDDGTLSGIVRGMSFDQRWNQSAAQVRRVFAARDSGRNLEDVRVLLDVAHHKTRVVVDDKGKAKTSKRKALTSEEAYEAHNLLGALPAAHRELFRKNYPKLIKAMELHLNASMREADGTHFFGDSQADKETAAQLELKVRDVAFWLDSPVAQLDMTLRMALKANLRQAIKGQLEGMKGETLATLHGDAARKAIVEGALGKAGDVGALSQELPEDERWLMSLKLDHVIEDKDESLKQGKLGFGKGGMGRALVNANRSTRQENRDCHREERRCWREAKDSGAAPEKKKSQGIFKQVGGVLGKKGIEIDNLALDEMQGAADRFGGGALMEFADFGERKGDNADEDRNRADLSFKPNEGVLDFDCPHLELVKMRFPIGDMVVETGPVTIKNVKLHVTWPTPTAPEQRHFISASTSSLDIAHIMVVKPGALIGVQSVSVSDVDYSSGEQKFDFGDNPGAAEALSLLKEHNPAKSLLSFILGAAGKLNNPRTQEQAQQNKQALVSAFSGKFGGALGGMAVQMGGMTATGVAYNADLFVEQAQVKGVSLVWDNRPSVTGRARMAQLTTMVSDGEARLAGLGASENDIKKKDTLTADIARWSGERSSIEGKLAGWETLEKLYQEIFEHQKLHGPGGNESEAALAAIRGHALAAGVTGAGAMSLGELAMVVQQQLTMDSGLVASVDEISAEGVEQGGKSIDRASMTDINVAGTGETFGAAMDPKLVKRLGSEDGENTRQGKPIGTAVGVDIGQVDVAGVALAGAAPKLESLAKTRDEIAGLRQTVAELQGRGDGLAAPDKERLAGDTAKLAALEAQWMKVVGDGLRYGEVVDELLSLEQSPGLAKVKTSADLLQRFKQLENLLRSEPTTVESILVSGITASGKTEKEQNGEAAFTTMSSKLGVAEVKATGVKRGDLSVGDVTLGGIAANASTTTTSDPSGEKSSHGAAGFSVAEVNATDIEKGGKTIASAKVEGLGGSGSYEQATCLDGDGELETRTDANGRLKVGKVSAQGIDGQGVSAGEAGIEGIELGVSSSDEGTKVDLSISKVYASGVGKEKGLDAARSKKASLQARIDEARKNNSDTSALTAELARLDEGLAAYVSAHSDEEAVLAEISAIDGRIDAAKGKLEAAKREVALYDHRVDKGAEKAKNKADKQRVATIADEIAVLKQERGDIKKKLAGPQQIIARFESTLGLEGTASVEDFSLSVSGLPGITELASGDIDLAGPVDIKLGVGPIRIPSLDYRAPKMNIGLASAEVARVEADATVTIEKRVLPDGKTSHGVGSVSLRSLSIPSIVGNGLSLTMPVDGETVRIELPTASIKGMALSDVHLPGLDKGSLANATGRFDISSIETSLSATMGDSLAANGALSIGHIHAEALASGAVDFGLQGLTLDKLGFKNKKQTEGEDGQTIVSSIIKMGGKASRLGKLDVAGSFDRNEGTLSTTVALGDLTLSGINYNGGATQLGVGFAQLKGASVTVGAKLRTGARVPGEGPFEYVDLSEIKADYLKGSNIAFKGSGTRRERFEDGTIKEHSFKTGVSLKSGTLHGLSVRGLRVVGEGLSKVSASLGSGSVQGLQVGMQKDGKHVLQANVSAAVSGVDIRLVDDDLSASFSSIKGDVSATMGQGDNAMNIDTKGIDVGGTKGQKATVNVSDMGSADQTIDASLPMVHAKQIGFEQGIKGSGHNKPFALGSATLEGVRFKSDKDVMAVDIAKGRGLMMGGVEVTGKTSGSTEDEKKAGAVGDKVKVPTQRVTWDNLAKSSLDGFLRLNYPDKSEFLRLNFAGNGVTLDLQENIDRMWSEWQKGFERDGESTFAYLWKASKTVLSTPGNLLWTALFRGLEAGFNVAGKKLLGDWPAIEKLILSTLNTNPKTSIVKGHKPEEGDQTFTAFTTTINQVIQEQVEPAIEKACDFGLVYDVIQGDYGRAATSTGTWLVEQTGNLIDWGGSFFGYENTTNIDDNARKQQEELRAQRRAEMEAMVKSGLDKVLGWGADMKLDTQGGQYRAMKAPNPNPNAVAPRQMLRTGLGLNLKGGGTLKSMALGTDIGLSNFKYSDGGNSASIDKLDIKAAVGGGINHEFEDEGLGMKNASIGAGGAVMVSFENLRYEQDKSFVRQLPAGTETARDRYKRTGTPRGAEPGDNGPLATNSAVTYDAGDYANRVNSGQPVVGDAYSSELKLGEKVKKKVIASTLDPLSGAPISQAYESSVIAARNAEIYGKYQTEYDARQKKVVTAE